ncbi:MAG: DUF1330 domain-containing protein [Alphaproteobacteria bacterium PA4]|nr:MAG: DUF1330 domain-containing protein [Alphaproteobacteria bacterium PA4]
MIVTNEVMPQSAAAQAFFADTDHGPMVMVNLLKFRDKADYPDGRETTLSGKEAYLIYGAAVQKCLALVGGHAVFSGDVSGIILGQVEELWDMVALAYYPSPQAMMQMVALPEYQGIEMHRFAGLSGQLNIRTKPGAGFGQ